MQFKQQYKEGKSGKNEYATPDYIYDPLNEVFGFNLDPAATHDNTKCLHYFTKESDGLKQSWKMHESQRVFVNPPYTNGSYSEWISKAVEEYKNSNHIVIVMLLPASWETKAFEPVWDWARYMIFPYKRIRFEIDGDPVGSAPFTSLIPIFMRSTLTAPEIDKLEEVGRVVDLGEGYRWL